MLLHKFSLIQLLGYEIQGNEVAAKEIVSMWQYLFLLFSVY